MTNDGHNNTTNTDHSPASGDLDRFPLVLFVSFRGTRPFGAM